MQKCNLDFSYWKFKKQILTFFFFVLYTGLSFTSSMPSIVAYNDGRGLKSHSGQLFIATSKNPLVMNTIYIIYMSIYI